MEFEGMEGSPAHTLATVDKLCLAYGNLLEEFEADIPLNLLFPLVPPSFTSPASRVSNVPAQPTSPTI